MRMAASYFRSVFNAGLQRRVIPVGLSHLRLHSDTAGRAASGNGNGSSLPTHLFLLLLSHIMFMSYVGSALTTKQVNVHCGPPTQASPNSIPLEIVPDSYRLAVCMTLRLPPLKCCSRNPDDFPFESEQQL